eukprot:Tbor_TRINITY_DN5941_c1_g8::TRINITY_DN5941_c1_g8_i1::g.18950::m.18950
MSHHITTILSRYTKALVTVTASAATGWYCYTRLVLGPNTTALSCQTSIFASKCSDDNNSVGSLSIPIDPSASTLVQDLNKSLVEKETINLLVTLILDTFQHPKAVSALKELFVDEFTQNEETLGNLKKFILDDVIKDPWVSDELIRMSKEEGLSLIAEPDIWPGESLEILKNAALDGLVDQRMKDELISTVKASINS